jgi:hypothetical protein
VKQHGAGHDQNQDQREGYSHPLFILAAKGCRHDFPRRISDRQVLGEAAASA